MKDVFGLGPGVAMQEDASVIAASNAQAGELVVMARTASYPLSSDCSDILEAAENQRDRVCL